MTDYQQEKHEAVIALQQELISLSGLDFVIDSSNDYCKVKLNGYFPIYVDPKNYNKKYTFILWDRLPYISYHDRKEIEKTLIKPKEVGVLNKKKILDWIAFLQELYRQLEQLSKRKVAKVEEFKAAIAKQEGLQTSQDGNNGRIIRNGIEFSYTIDSSNGYISKKIAVLYSVDNSLESFEKLASNQFT